MKTLLALAMLFAASVIGTAPAQARNCYTNCIGNSCTTTCY